MWGWRRGSRQRKSVYHGAGKASSFAGGQCWGLYKLCVIALFGEVGGVSYQTMWVPRNPLDPILFHLCSRQLFCVCLKPEAGAGVARRALSALGPVVGRHPAAPRQGGPGPSEATLRPRVDFMSRDHPTPSWASSRCLWSLLQQQQCC